MGLKDNKLKIVKKKKEESRKKVVRTILASLLIIFSCSLGMLAATLVNSYITFKGTKGNKGTIGQISDAIKDYREITNPITEPVNVLLLGSDISYDGRGRHVDEGPTRSDTMMLAHIDPIKKSVSVLSIPRDTRVLIPEHNYYDKINSAFAYGGERLARKTVANLTGVPIQHYVLLKVFGLMNIIDIMGGVEVDVEKDMHYIDNTAKLNINLKKGRQVLNGAQAHGYVRFRHDEIGDIGRVQRQQKFVNAVAAKLLSPGTIVKLPELVAEVQKNIVTDMPQNELLRLGYFLKSLKREDIKMVMLPGRFGNIRGASYWLMDEAGVRDVVSEMFPDSIYATTPQLNPGGQTISTPGEISEADKRKYRITILNGTNEPRLAAKAARFLRDNGWSVWSVSETKDRLEKTQIIVQTGKDKPVPLLAASLGVNPEIVNASVGDIYTDFTITVGNDFAASLKKKQEEMDVGTKKLSEH